MINAYGDKVITTTNNQITNDITHSSIRQPHIEKRGRID